MIMTMSHRHLRTVFARKGVAALGRMHFPGGAKTCKSAKTHFSTSSASHKPSALVVNRPTSITWFPGLCTKASKLAPVGPYLALGGLAMLLCSGRWQGVALCDATLNSKRRSTLRKLSSLKRPAKEEKQQGTSDADKWRLLFRLVREDKWYYVIAALSSVLSSVLAGMQGRVIGQLFDLMGVSNFDTLVAPLENLFKLVVGQSAMSFLSSFALAVATTEFGRRMRLAFYESSLRKDIAQYDGGRTGELVGQLSEDIGDLQTAVRSAFSKGVEGATSLVTSSIYLYYASPKMAFAMFCILPIMSASAHLLGVGLRGLSDKIRRASNRATGLANETLGAIHTVRVFGAEDRELARYSNELTEVSRLKRAMAFYAGGFYSMLYLGINLITLVICGFGGLLVSRGELTRGGIASVVTQVQILERSMAKLSVVSAQLVKALRSSAHVFESIQDQPVVNTARGGKGLVLDPQQVRGEIGFRSVSFSYPSRPDVQVLENFNLVISPGQVVALVGQSGSGKSTLSALLSRLYDVQGGSVEIDGVSVRDLQPHSLHSTVGIVSQEPTLFSTSVLDNIRYGRPEATEEEVVAAAKAANAHNFIMEFPEGYKTELGERGVLLSGGQRQRLAIARVILRDPAVLVLDEATSALDNESEKLVQEALDSLMEAKRRTTLVIAHRLSTARNADVIVVLSKGKVIESGTHAELIKHGGTYAKLYSLQQVI